MTIKTDHNMQCALLLKEFIMVEKDLQQQHKNNLLSHTKNTAPAYNLIKQFCIR